jgi:molybdopterin-guanine dinucleotide biosynthesis protein A
MRKTAGMGPAAPYAAVILAGGTAVRMGGVDKAGVEYAGRTLLEHALRAVTDAAEVVVVGEQVPTSRPVTFVREDPPLGGPAAGLLAGVDALAHRPAGLFVLAVDMPFVTAATFRRMTAAADGHDGAFLVDGDGRRQLAGVLDPAAVARARPDDPTGLPLHRLLQAFDLASVAADRDEARDVDSWSDLRDLPDGPGSTV